MSSVTRVTIHHEGAGEPTNTARGAGGGYTYWIGVDRWTRLRPVSSSFATLHYNHVSVDVCLSGERNGNTVDADDVRMIGECIRDARMRGEVVDNPNTYPHRQSFATNCPGDRTMERFPAIALATQVHAAPPAPPIDWKRVQYLVNWRARVSRRPLRFGNVGPDVQTMNDLLTLHGFLKRSGNRYGLASRAAVYKFKSYHHWPNDRTHTGLGFGAKAADLILR